MLACNRKFKIIPKSGGARNKIQVFLREARGTRTWRGKLLDSRRAQHVQDSRQQKRKQRSKRRRAPAVTSWICQFCSQTEPKWSPAKIRNVWSDYSIRAEASLFFCGNLPPNKEASQYYFFIFFFSSASCSTPPSHHPWLKDCSRKQGTGDKRSEALMRSALCVCVAMLFAVSCVLRVGTETAFDEYLQRDCSRIKNSNLARCVILSLALWEFCSLIERVGGNPQCLSGQLASGLLSEMFQGYLINHWPHLEPGVISYMTSSSSSLLAVPFFLLQTCLCVWVDRNHGSRPPSLLWIIQLITAPSFFIPNSGGRSCQTAYADRRGDFEMLLVTQGYNYPLFLAPYTHSCHSISVFCAYCCCLCKWWREESLIGKI